MVFKNYAKYYNLLYSDKSYKNEVLYVLGIIKEHAKEAKSILDIGCGTGIHASILGQNNFTVKGIDLSEEMIEIANSKNYQNCNFEVANAKNFSLNKKFDVITSLFHVISYQTEKYILEQVLMNVQRHLKKNGLFIFDFWYSPAVLTQKAETRVKRLNSDSIDVVRISEPLHHYNKNVIDVNFDIHIKDKTTSKTDNIKELHKMRYFSLPELNFILSKCELTPILYEEWLTKDVPSEKTWGVCCIAKKL